MPFGNGTRACPGNELANLEILVFLHHLTTKYRLAKWIITKDTVIATSFSLMGGIIQNQNVLNDSNCNCYYFMQVVFDRCKKWDSIWPFCHSTEWIAHNTISQELNITRIKSGGTLTLAGKQLAKDGKITLPKIFKFVNQRK